MNKNWLWWWNWMALIYVVSNIGGSKGIQFLIDREECMSQKVDFGSTLHFSFVVLKVKDTSYYNPHGVDLLVKGPSGEQIQDFRDKIKGKSEIIAEKEGVYRFCFINKSPYEETIDFYIRSSHHNFHNELAKDEHLKPLFEHIEELEEALDDILFQQHWLEAQTERQAIVNEAMSKRAIHKVLYESTALIGATVLQVYLLKRLFKRKLEMTRV